MLVGCLSHLKVCRKEERKLEEILKASVCLFKRQRLTRTDVLLCLSDQTAPLLFRVLVILSSHSQYVPALTCLSKDTVQYMSVAIVRPSLVGAAVILDVNHVIRLYEPYITPKAMLRH